jgi:long-chain acyl-CoA synthetase
MNHERAWLASYPKGMPADIDVDEFASVAAVFDTSVARFADLPAYSSFGKELTFGQANVLVEQFAAYLQCELKLKKGDRIAIMMPNCLQYPVAIFGALRAGLTVVNVNPLYTARELKHQLCDAQAAALVVVDNFGHTVQQVIDELPVKHVISTGLGDLLGAKGAVVNFVLKYVKKMVPDYDLPGAVRFKQAIKLGRRHTRTPVLVDHEDIAFLQYTGGTTGVAKGAILTHGNVIANMQQISAWIGPANLVPGKEVGVTALPLYHIFSLTVNGLVFTKLGVKSILITNPRDMPGFIKEIADKKISIITGVNTLFNGLLNTPGIETVDFSAIKLSIGGGMAVQRAVAERWKKVTGCPLIEGYGLTETSPVACVNPLDATEYSGAIGMPLPSTHACVKAEDGSILAMGEVGELCIAGPQVMRGYWRRDEDTASTIDADNWLHTGDMARMDASGNFFIVDRKKDMILVSGFNVYPNEIEDVIAMMPGVMEVAAVGVPDEKSGEAVKVVIVRKDPGLTAEQVKTHARAHLTGYKHPRIVEFRDELPKTNVGKILRRELRDNVKP